jgi:tRNA modification GTPase
LVTSVAGTTRDYISEWIDIDGLPVELFDTAGLRSGRGKVEKAGIEGTRRLIKRADLILYLYDVTGRSAKSPELKLARSQAMILLLNKVDLLGGKTGILEKWNLWLGDDFEIIPVSAKTGKGLTYLLQNIYKKAGIADLTESLVVTSHRHKSKIDTCLKHLGRVRQITDMPPEIVSFELRQAADRIGEITGAVYTEEILDEIFSNFCIGK